MKSSRFGFTLIEIMVGILVSTTVLIAGFSALSMISLARIKLIEETEMTKEAFYLSQKLFEEIKAGGTLDYEEYFNRNIVNMSPGASVGSGYYIKPTGFGNFGTGGTIGTTTYGFPEFYYCRSGSGAFMGTGGCVGNNNNLGGKVVGLQDQNYVGVPQRYGQYAFQFIDFNRDQNGDNGDESGNGDIRGDADDEHLGEGPFTFTGGVNVHELYLISGDGKKRTFFRWNVGLDPNAPSGATCDTTATGSGCLGNIEILKLTGEDMGFNHDGSGTGSSNGVVDTWKIDRTFAGGDDIVAGSNGVNYWQSLFGGNIHVKDFKIFAYPNIDTHHAWKNDIIDANINPYVRIDMTLVPSWKKRVQMKGQLPEIKISTTINLTEYFSQ